MNCRIFEVCTTKGRRWNPTFSPRLVRDISYAALHSTGSEGRKKSDSYRVWEYFWVKRLSTHVILWDWIDFSLIWEKFLQFWVLNTNSFASTILDVWGSIKFKKVKLGSRFEGILLVRETLFRKCVRAPSKRVAMLFSFRVDILSTWECPFWYSRNYISYQGREVGDGYLRDSRSFQDVLFIPVVETEQEGRIGANN